MDELGSINPYAAATAGAAVTSPTALANVVKAWQGGGREGRDGQAKHGLEIGGALVPPTH